jgi:integrase
MYAVKGRQLCRVLGKDTPLEFIDAESVDGYVSQRLKEKAARTTIARELTTLRGALKLAKRHGKYHKDLAEVMPEFSPKYRPKIRALSEREIARLLKALPLKRAAVVAFLLATGATYPSEMAALKRSDVDMTRWMVHLPGTKRETRDRHVPIVPFARTWLRSAMAYWPFERWTNVRRDMHKACDEARVGRCSPNDLRRSIATLMRARGVEPSLIGVFLGHGDSRMAERVYGRLAPEQLQHLLNQRLRVTARPQRTA